MSFAALLVVVLVTHIPYFSLPYFWDELGQFIPASLDLMRAGKLVPVSTVPNVHPPGVMAYLALTWKLAGYSLPATRIAMLVMAAAGLYFAFLLAVRMCREVPGTPAFAVVVLLLVTPLLYTQSMMAQLDMPAMVFTTLALWLFLEERFIACALACTALVLVKETGAVVPLVCAGWLVLMEKRVRMAVWFALPFVMLAAWLVFLRNVTGNWLGDTGFANYNVTYSLNPVRMIFALVRRVWFLFGADFRWIGTAAIVYGLRRTKLFRTREWAIGGLFFAGHVALVTAFGGATLERYLLPVFPLLYIATATGFSTLPRFWRRGALVILAAGMFVGLYWNPPYPFPHENNLAMVDFVELQQATAEYLEHAAVPGAKIASAWPYSSALRNPDLLFVHRPFAVVETTDFHARNVIDAARRDRPDLLVTYSRTWETGFSLMHVAPFEYLVKRYYDYEPQITSEQIETELGMKSRFRFSQRGQWIEVYSR